MSRDPFLIFRCQWYFWIGWS